jgi:putative PIN family toxin of toxin-antitoxin system
MSRRVVLDTSVLVSAALRIGSTPYRALQQALATCDLCASADTLGELERVLGRKKFELYLHSDARNDFVKLIRRHAHLFAVSSTDLAVVEPPCRDPNDNQFLALAQVSQADMLVSSDDDLLVLNPWHSIAIVTPADFLSNATPL